MPYANLRARIERRCVEEEIALLGRMKASGYDGTDAWAAFLRARLADPWWTENAAFNRRHRYLEERAAPQWVLRFHKRFFQPPTESVAQRSAHSAEPSTSESKSDSPKSLPPEGMSSNIRARLGSPPSE